MTSPALRFPSRDWSPQPVPLPPNPLPALALLLSILGCWVFWTVGYLSGRTAERGSQLGQVLALQPRADSLEALVRDSREMLERLARIQNPPRIVSTAPSRPVAQPSPGANPTTRSQPSP